MWNLERALLVGKDCEMGRCFSKGWDWASGQPVLISTHSFCCHQIAHTLNWWAQIHWIRSLNLNNSFKMLVVFLPLMFQESKRLFLCEWKSVRPAVLSFVHTGLETRCEMGTGAAGWPALRPRHTSQLNTHCHVLQMERTAACPYLYFGCQGASFA